jgi:hypothetical protein
MGSNRQNYDCTNRKTGHHSNRQNYDCTNRKTGLQRQHQNNIQATTTKQPESKTNFPVGKTPTKPIEEGPAARNQRQQASKKCKASKQNQQREEGTKPGLQQPRPAKQYNTA